MKKAAAKDIAEVAMMLAIIETCKYALAFLPNIELTSFWIILFTRRFGGKIAFVIPAFILLEGVVYGFGPWWIMYLYVWPILALAAWLLRSRRSWLFWSILSCVFGLCFGLLCSLVYVWLGAVGEGFRSGLYAAFSWWVAGIPWDILHGVGNFALMSVLYTPITAVMEKIYPGDSKTE